MKQKIIVTALPNGINTRSRTGTLRVSAVFSLQVEDVNTTLQNVPDMLNWAERIRTAKFMVQYNGALVEAKPVGTAPDPVLWKNIFTPTVKVRSFEQEELHKLPLLSYPVKHIVNFISTAVAQTGSKFTSALPDSNFYTDNATFTDISDYAVGDYPKKGREKITLDSLSIDKQLGRRLRSQLVRGTFIPFNNQASPTMDFAQLKNFHGLYRGKNVAHHVPPEKPDFEFHAVLSVLSSYPQLQRKLGLVIDLEFEAPDTRIVAAGAAGIRIFPSGLNCTTASTVVSPATACIKTDNGFYARPGTDSLIDKGYLRINTDRFTVFQLDTDGAALKLCQQMDSLQLKKAKHIFYGVSNNLPNAAGLPFFNNEAPRREGLPSNRSAGIGLALNGMAAQLSGKFNRMNELRTKLVSGSAAPAGISGNNITWVVPEELLTADDTTIGYRMDIMPMETGKWFSLHKRTNQFSFLNAGGTSIPIPGMEPDEGFIQLSVAEEKTDSGPQLKVSEAIARWEGWSLSVPRPGSALNDPLNSGAEMYDKNIPDQKKRELAKYQTPASADFKLNVQHSIVKDSLPMLRFGKKYATKIRTVDMAGNSVDLAVEPENKTACIRAGIKYMRYEPAAAPFLVLGNKVRDGESSEVLVIRSNDGLTCEQYENANKDSKNTVPYPPSAVRHVKPPRTTLEMITTHGLIDDVMGSGSASKAAALYEIIKTSKDPAFNPADATYTLKVTESETPLTTVEYLADPMAAGVAFFLSADDPNPKVPNPAAFDQWVSFYFDEPTTAADLNRVTRDKWMNPKPFRIKLKEGIPGLAWKKENRTLEISLPKGIMFKMYYASFWRPDDVVQLCGVLDMMGMSNLTGAAGDAIAKGHHWMFSPFREITFVHAVQQPLPAINTTAVPAAKALETDRNYGDNFALVNTHLLVHGPSTGQLDLEATWTDWIDDPAYEDPAMKEDLQKIPAHAKVFHFTTLYGVNDYVFGDVEGIKNNPFTGLRHQFNDTKHRRVKYKLIATSRYRENFFQLNEDKKGLLPLTRENWFSKEVIIPSSARPAAPEIAYVIPTFEWDRVTKNTTIFTGRASGLRVYLKRPWYSSGEGEQLAVVLNIPSNPTLGGSVSSAGAPVTTWGTDPAKLSGLLLEGITPMPDVFLNVPATDKVNMVPVAENKTARVNIVAYTPKYDNERHLYYVDILLNIHLSYFPFVRLALARYQPNSVKKDDTDCCLSPIVLADYIQVPAPRASSLEFKGAKNNIVVAISGTAPAVSNTGSMYRHRVEFIVEPIEQPSTENTHLIINAKPIDSYSYILQDADIKNFAFYHAHPFSLPAAYSNTPYRIRVLEYEVMERDRFKPDPVPGMPRTGSMPATQRLVFADVYEVK